MLVVFKTMKLSNVLSFLSVVLLACVSPQKSFAATNEARGVWLHLTDFSIDPVQGKKEVHETVQKFADANFNLIMPWVLSEYVAALSDTNYLPAAPSAKWDALGELTHEAALRKMKVEIWYSFTYYKSPQSPEFDPKHVG